MQFLSKNFIKRNNIKVDQLYARGTDEARERITIAVQGLKEVTLSERQVDVQLLGYINFQGFIDSKSIEGLLKDQLAYVVDASGDDYFTGQEDAFAHPLTWTLEDLSGKYKNK